MDKQDPERKYNAGAIAIVTVGLPGRGKSFMARKLSRYLKWLGLKTRVFNVGHYRRHWIGVKLPPDYFDPTNKEFTDERMRIANMALEDMVKYLEEVGQVAIYDASNTVEERRRQVIDILTSKNIQVVFLEAICTNDDLVDSTIQEVKLSSPDYRGVPGEAVKADFMNRINLFNSNYTTIEDLALSFVKIINIGEEIIANKIKGYVPSSIVYYLTNLHMSQRKIYFCRHGESAPPTIENRLDPHLSELGKSFTRQMKEFLKEKDSPPTVLWTSVKVRSLETAAILEIPALQKSNLIELNMGICQGLSETEIQNKYPADYVRNARDPLNSRYPRGESYVDLAKRLEYIILELEKQKDNVIIIAQETVLRCLYAYFTDRPQHEIPFISIPRHIVIELSPRAYGYYESRYFIPPIPVPTDPISPIVNFKAPTSFCVPIFANEFRAYPESD